MYKTILTTVICLTLSLSSFIQGATYGGGSGEPNDPFQIWTPQQMNAIGLNAGDWGSHFKLMADIDMSDYTNQQFHIIGNFDTPFSGTFNGDGHIIRNLTYTTTESVDYESVFGCTFYASIYNLGIENISFSSSGEHVGGLVGLQESSMLAGCYVTGSVDGANCVGGLVGTNLHGILNTCYAAGSVNGTGDYTGGLVGHSSGSVNVCYAMGSVTGGSFVGGLIGWNEFGGVTDCYTAASVSGNNFVGGLIGTNSGSLNGCFWDTQTSGMEEGKGVGDPHSDPSGVTGLETTAMRTVVLM